MKKENLKKGVFLLWDNKDSHREIFGPFSICEVVLARRIKDEYYLKFQDNNTPQYMTYDIIQQHCIIIDPNDYPEYFI